MFAVHLLEEAAGEAGSIWVPVLVLGWFLLMTIVGWQVSLRTAAVENHSRNANLSHSESNPSEFDNH